MILTSQVVFSPEQVITATAISTNVWQIPTTQAYHGGAAALYGDLGKGNPIPLLVQAVQTFATLTSLTITLETSASADLSSSTVLWSSGAVPLASLVAGWQSVVEFLPKNSLGGKYLGLRYTVGGSNATAGAIYAGFAMGIQDNIRGA